VTIRLAVASEDFGSELKPAIALAARMSRVHGLRLNVRTEVRPQDFSETGLRQLRHTIQQYNLQTAGLYFPSRSSLWESSQLDARLEAIRSAIPLARKLGTSEFLIRVGRIPDPDGKAPVSTGTGPTNSNVDSLTNPFAFAPQARVVASVESPARQFETLCLILNDLSSVASLHGASLQLMLAHFPVEHLKRLLSAVTSGPVGIVLDPAACLMGGTDPCTLLRTFYNRIGYVRGRDAVTGVEGAGIEVPVGDGATDWTTFMALLAEAEYQGWMCVERAGGDSRAADVQAGVARLTGLLPPQTA
jgi:sugar phosphate isomerase/epimerase